jgi:elongator complex protein 4
MESSFQRRGRRFRNKQPPAADGTAEGAAGANPAGGAAGAGADATPGTSTNPAAASSATPSASTTQGGSGLRSSAAAAPARPVTGGSGGPAPGTRPGLYGQTLVSTGMADMDDLLGGGLPLGTVLLLGSAG